MTQTVQIFSTDGPLDMVTVSFGRRVGDIGERICVDVSRFGRNSRYDEEGLDD